MTLNSALLSLYEHLNASDGVVLLSFDDVSPWGDEVIHLLVNAGLLKPVAKARSIECVGCEQRCFQEVVMASGVDNRAFIVCDVPEMQAQMGRVAVSLDRLKRWRASWGQIGTVLHALLGLDSVLQEKDDTLRLGMLQGGHGRRWLVLNKHPLSIEINRVQLPINEVLYADGSTLLLDEARINALINAKEREAGKVYSPSTEKAELSKQNTQAMYQDWRDAYHRAKQKHPKKSKTWHSQQIAKQDIAKGRNAQTIYKHLK